MERKCEVCESMFDGRSDARTCSDKCKKSLQRIKGTMVDELSGTFIKGDSPELIERGQNVSEKKLAELKGTDLQVVDSDVPCKTVETRKDGGVYFDIEKDLKLDMKKDLGCFAWTKDGIFIKPDITIAQVQNIARIIHAKHGRPCPEFRECR